MVSQFEFSKMNQRRDECAEVTATIRLMPLLLQSGYKYFPSDLFWTPVISQNNSAASLSERASKLQHANLSY